MVLGKNSYRIARSDMQPLDTIDEDLAGLRIVDVCAMLLTQTVATYLFAIQSAFDGFRGSAETSTERYADGDENNRQTDEQNS